MMDMKKMGQQMIDFYKTTFDNSFNTMMMLQEQMERLGPCIGDRWSISPKRPKRI